MNLKRYEAIVVCMAVALGCNTQAPAGPDWCEFTDGGGDTGNLPGTSQMTAGEGELENLSGALAGQGVLGGDFQDMFAINITDAENFSATVMSAQFDTQLWLFDANGLGVLGNDNARSGTLLSAFGNMSTDNSQSQVEEGLHFIAISGFDSDPVSLLDDGGNGLPIFDMPPGSTEVSGPDGPGGEFAIEGWTTADATRTGDYLIELEGTGFAVPSPAGLTVLLLAGVVRRRRRV